MHVTLLLMLCVCLHVHHVSIVCMCVQAMIIVHEGDNKSLNGRIKLHKIALRLTKFLFLRKILNSLEFHFDCLKHHCGGTH